MKTHDIKWDLRQYFPNLIGCDLDYLAAAELPANLYWRLPFKALASHRQLTEYMILQVEGLEPSHMTGSTASINSKVAELLLDVFVSWDEIA